MSTTEPADLQSHGVSRTKAAALTVVIVAVLLAGALALQARDDDSEPTVDPAVEEWDRQVRAWNDCLQANDGYDRGCTEPDDTLLNGYEGDHTPLIPMIPLIESVA